MRDLLQDLRFGARMLLKNPGFTLAAVTTLALGIGLNAATFSVVSGLLLKPLPGVEEPDQLVQLYQAFDSDFLYGSNSIPHYRDLRDRSGEVFESVAAWTFTPLSIAEGGRSERVMGMLVSANFFQTFGVDPVVGRAFVPGVEDEGAEAHPVAVLGHGYWLDRFGGDPGVVGRTVTVNGRPFEVVGVAPADFNSPLAVAAPPLFIPLVMQPVAQPGRNLLEARGNSFMNVHARLRDGVTMERAREGTEAVFAGIRADHPDEYDEDRGVTFVPQSEAGIYPTFRSAQMGLSGVMMVVVGLLLLIACVNVANLFLARSRERAREIGVRMGLGASRGRIVRQLLTESLLFAAVAGAAGIALAWAVTKALSGFRPPFEGPWVMDVGLDPTVLAFTTVIALGTGIVFGLAPALLASRPDTLAALRTSTARAGGGGTSRGLVVAQMALSLVLLIGSGLFLRSLQGATALDKGFDSRGLLLASVDPGLQGYSRDEARAFYRDLLDRVRALPGVDRAALGEIVPLGMGSQQRGVEVPGYEFAEDEGNSVDYNLVGPGYFEAMGIPLLAGRGFQDSDGADAPGVVVVNQRFADRFWPDQDPLGRIVRTAGEDRQVVGVVPDGRYRTLGEAPLPYMYLAQDQVWTFGTTLHIRAEGSVGGLAGQLRAVIRELDPDLPVFDVRTMDNHLGYALLPARLGGGALGLFGLLGLFLAAVGIYGVMAYSVSRRTRELGIRTALGAERGAVIRQVLGEGLRLTGVGMGLGLVGAALGARAVQGMLYDVGAFDPVAFVGVPLLLVGVAVLAVWIPARRAASVDPVRALRAD